MGRVEWNIGVVVQHSSPGIKQTWVQIPALSFTSCGLGAHNVSSMYLRFHVCELALPMHLYHRAVMRIEVIDTSTA